MIDPVVFFDPPEELLKILKIEEYVRFGKDGEGIILEGVGKKYVRKFFLKNYDKYVLIGYRSDDKKDILNVAGEGLIDFIVNPPLDFKILRFIKKEEIFVVFSLKDLKRETGKWGAYLMDLIEISKEYKIPIILSSFAKDIWELESERSLISLLKEFEARDMIREILFENPKKMIELGKIRKRIILPGMLYVEEEI